MDSHVTSNINHEYEHFMLLIAFQSIHLCSFLNSSDNLPTCSPSWIITKEHASWYWLLVIKLLFLNFQKPKCVLATYHNNKVYVQEFFYHYRSYITSSSFWILLRKSLLETPIVIKSTWQLNASSNFCTKE